MRAHSENKETIRDPYRQSKIGVFRFCSFLALSLFLSCVHTEWQLQWIKQWLRQQRQRQYHLLVRSCSTRLLIATDCARDTKNSGSYVIDDATTMWRIRWDVSIVRYYRRLVPMRTSEQEKIERNERNEEAKHSRTSTHATDDIKETEKGRRNSHTSTSRDRDRLEKWMRDAGEWRNDRICAFLVSTKIREQMKNTLKSNDERRRNRIQIGHTHKHEHRSVVGSWTWFFSG